MLPYMDTEAVKLWADFQIEVYKALSKVYIYKISKIEGFLAIKDFLEAISMRLVLV